MQTTAKEMVEALGAVGGDTKLVSTFKFHSQENAGQGGDDICGLWRLLLVV